MGSGFSAGPFPKPVRRFVNLDMVVIRKHMEMVDKLINKRYKDDTYMTRNQFQKCFQLSDALTYSLFRLFDPHGDSRVMSLDVWGAIVLASSARIEEKLKVLFELTDSNEDNHMGPLDCELLMRCASRGFSRLKGIPIPENSLVQKMVNLMFESNIPELSETGEISTFTFREFFQICELLQTYTANLGTVAVAVDIQKLISQRASLIKEIAELESTIEHIHYDKSIEEEDIRSMLADRGGDSKLLLLHEEIDEPHEPTLEELRQAHEARMTEISRANREAQRNRRMQRALENGTLYIAADEERLTANDAEAFTREDSGGAVGGGLVSVSDGVNIRSLIEYEKLLEFRWRAFTPQSADKLVKLDMDKIEDFFESAGVRLTDDEATDCLNSLPTNQLGRHSLADVLKWFEKKHFNEMVHGIPRVSDPPPKQYVLLGVKFKNFLDSCYSRVQTFAKILEKQRKVADHLLLLRKRREGNPTLLRLEDGIESNALNSTAMLASWRRRRKLEDTSKFTFNIEFGQDVEEPDEVDAVPQASSPLKNTGSPSKGKPTKPGGKPEPLADNQKGAKEAALKNAMKNIAEGSNDWKFQIRINVQTNSTSGSAGDKSLLDDLGCLRLHPSLFTFADVAGHFTVTREEHDIAVGGTMTSPKDATEGGKSNSNGDKDKGNDTAALGSTGANKKKKKPLSDTVYCKTAIWASLMCKKGMSYEQVEITRETFHRTFEGIPYDFRSNVYRYVKSQAFYLPAEEARRGPDYLGEKCIPPISQYDYVVVVVLLHDDDVYDVVESHFTGSNVAISRSLWDLSLSFNCRQDLADVISSSREYDNYEARLFGPQEEEIGEEGMNPIRFAKSCRKRRQDIESAAEAANKMSIAELRDALAEMGLNNMDKARDVLLDRIQRGYEHKLSLVGSGELSEFGKNVAGRIFDMFDEDNDGGLSLWEMNTLLLAVRTPTIPNKKEYDRIMQTNDFLGDANGYLTKLGLCAYYERFGRLAEDITMLGLGSMDELLQGELDVQLRYDPEAFCTVMPLLEKHTLTQLYFKKLLNFVCTLRDMTWDAKVDKISHVFDIFRDLGLHKYIQYLCGGLEGYSWLQYAATAPGMVSNLVDLFSQFLADGELGVLREMKVSAAEKIPKFSFYGYDWDPVFDKAVHRMLVSFDDDAGFSDDGKDDERNAADSGDEGTDEGTVSINGNADEGHAEDDNGKNQNVDEQSIGSKLSSFSQIKADKSCLRGFLPQLIPTTNLGNEIKTMFTDAKNALLGLQGAIRVTRKQRELLVKSQREWEKGAVLLSRLRDEAVKTWPIHASAFYDCLRVFPIDFCGIGCGTAEFGASVSFKGLAFSSLDLPKGDGSPCATRKILFDKIYRALQRKAAAIAAIERQKERARLAKEQAEREAREELERQRRMMDPQVLYDEEENTMVVKAMRALESLRQVYIGKKEEIEAERKAKEAEMIRLGMMEAPVDDDADEGIESNLTLDDEGATIPKVRKAIVVTKVKPPEINDYKASLWECQQSEVSGVLQPWYDLLELREGRYRLVPLRILRISACQNNIAMMLIENYIHFRKSAASQRRMTEANSLLLYMTETVHSWLSREADIDITEARELAEVEARAKSKGGSRSASRASEGHSFSANGSKNGADNDIESAEQPSFNTILDGLFPERRDAALPDLRKRGISAVPFVLMLQNYVSFVRYTIALKSYFVESKPVSRSSSRMFSAKMSGSATPSGKIHSPGRPLSSSLADPSRSRPDSPQAVHFGGADVLVIAHDEGEIPSTYELPASRGSEPKPVKTEFIDYRDFMEYSEDCEESIYLRSQTRIHGLVSQLTEKEAEDLAARKYSLELTPILLLPKYFFDIVRVECPKEHARSTNVVAVVTEDEEADPELRKQDETQLLLIEQATLEHGEMSLVVAENRVTFGRMLSDRNGQEERAISQFEKALSIQLESTGKLSNDTVSTMQQIGKLKERTGKQLEALSAYYAVLERYSHMFGKDCQEIADVLKSIASVYHTLGRRDACLLLLKKIRQMEKLLRQNSAFKNKISKTFIEVYSELAAAMSAAGAVGEAEKLSKSCLKLCSRFQSKKDSDKYSKKFVALLSSVSRCNSPDNERSPHGEKHDKENDTISRASSMPILESPVSAKAGESVKGVSRKAVESSDDVKADEESDDEDTPRIWKELNRTCDEVLNRRELRVKQQEAEKARLRAIAEAEEEERKRLRDALETPEMLAAAAKKARQDAIRKKREKAEAMRNQSVIRRARLYEMIQSDQITTYFNAVSNDTEGSAHLNWENQDAADIVDPFADLHSEPAHSRPTTGQGEMSATASASGVSELADNSRPPTAGTQGTPF